MRGYIFSLIVLLFILNSYFVVADVNCQYKDVEQYNETEQLLVDKANNIQGNLPRFSDFITEKNNITSFIISNPNPFKILVHLNFTVEGFGGGGKQYRVDVKPLQNRKVEELCYDNDKLGYCFINESSITYFVSTPDSPDLGILYPKNLTVTKTKSVLNKVCSKSSDCGTGICNGAGFCSDGTKIDCCPEGKLNCNNISCLISSIKKAGETYSCVWECKSDGNEGICMLNDKEPCEKTSDCLSNECNFDKYCGPFIGCKSAGTISCKNTSCAIPSIKKVGESYSCEWECESQRGSNGICRIGIRPLIFYLSIIILLIGIGTYLIRRYTSGKAHDKIIDEANKKAEEIIDIARTNAESRIHVSKDRARSILEQANIKADEDKHKAKILEKEAADIREKARIELLKIKDSDTIKKIKAEAEKEAKNKSDEADRLRSEASSELTQAKEKASKITEDANQEAEKIKLTAKKEAELIIIKDKYWKELINWKGEGRLTRNDEGYPIWKNSGKPFHIEYYKGQYRDFYGKEPLLGRQIHHIDNIKTNFHFENLIDISPTEHNKIANSRISIDGGWEQGLKVLLDCLGWKESQLPEHIKKELKRRKEQKLLRN